MSCNSRCDQLSTGPVGSVVSFFSSSSVRPFHTRTFCHRPTRYPAASFCALHFKSAVGSEVSSPSNVVTISRAKRT